jgi:hypothetical protein
VNPATAAKLKSWLDHLAEPDAPGHTSDELGKAWGVGIHSARANIRALIAKGVLRQTGYRSTHRANGRRDRVPVYAEVTPAPTSRRR